MRKRFPYSVSVAGLGEVEGYFFAADGEIEAIELPDATTVEVMGGGFINRQKDLLIELLARRIYSAVSLSTLELDETREPVDWSSHAPKVL